MLNLGQIGNKIATGAVGLTGTELLSIDPTAVGNQAAGVLDLVVKLAIGVGTLISLFKRKKPKTKKPE